MNLKDMLIAFLVGSIGGFLTAGGIDMLGFARRKRQHRKHKERVDALMRGEMRKEL